MLLVWDNLTGHDTVDVILWLVAHGIMPLFTPLGGSYLNIVEIEIAIITRECLRRRAGDKATLERQVAALEAERNEQRRTITWSFTTYDARQKVRRLYPIAQSYIDKPLAIGTG